MINIFIKSWIVDVCVSIFFNNIIDNLHIKPPSSIMDYEEGDHFPLRLSGGPLEHTNFNAYVDSRDGDTLIVKITGDRPFTLLVIDEKIVDISIGN
jgi:hypothetical protein